MNGMVATVLAFLAPLSHLTSVSRWGLMRNILFLTQGQLLAEQIRCRRICRFAALLQPELFRVYTD